MVIVLIHTALRDDIDQAAYDRVSARMDALVVTMPGFVSMKSYTADDGEAIFIVHFASAEALAAWRNHPEHLEAQRQGKEVFYRSYDVTVCDVVRAYQM
jgi:heme-degrading monooxygenase HmoA